MTTAAVVGSGPNGLAAAIALAREGVRVRVVEAADRPGGGARSSELTMPGLVHDDCSAFHPMGSASPFLQSLGLERYGLRWRHAEVDLAHPLDGGRAAVLDRSVERTADGLGADGPAWRRLFTPLARDFDALAEDILRPLQHVPRHPLLLTGFGVRALQPATVVARRWRSDEARALFGGAAAHAFQPLRRPLTASVGLMLTAAGHAHGWPVAVGGSQAVTDALVGLLGDLGGIVETGVRVTRLEDLGSPDLILLDLAPPAAAEVIGSRLPDRVAGAYRRYRFGPAAFKLDLAVEGGIPWTNEALRKAGTVHLGGTLEEMVRTEKAVADGRMPERPFILLGQQHVADPSRSAGDVHPVWAYAHVPHGYTEDATDAMLSQIERFAPGVRARVRASAARTPRQLEAYNPNYVGGDIATGANDLQVVLRPRLALDPYGTGVDGVYLCSAATPPGAGVHGMCGFNAARAALRALR